ncbi:MAG: hypothetical protein JNL11_04935 [Bdellovibrionaceae bacterium]|nr:hypothetical protein [Pseudobdellovibrionaceae bacterium]
MNMYFWFSTISFGLIFIFHFFTSFFISAARTHDDIQHKASVFEITFHGVPMWMTYLFLFTFGIFFLIFGFKKRLSLKK